MNAIPGEPGRSYTLGDRAGEFALACGGGEFALKNSLAWSRKWVYLRLIRSSTWLHQRAPRDGLRRVQERGHGVDSGCRARELIVGEGSTMLLIGGGFGGVEVNESLSTWQLIVTQD